MSIDTLAGHIRSIAIDKAKKLTEAEEKECNRCGIVKRITAFPADPRPRVDGTLYRYPYCSACKRKKYMTEGAGLRRVCPCCGVDKCATSFISKDADICRSCANSAPIKPNCNPWLLRAWI